jgi:hypothetical protein
MIFLPLSPKQSLPSTLRAFVAAPYFFIIIFAAIFATYQIASAYGHSIPSTFSIEPNSILEKDLPLPNL